ncbi:hypothetical protein K438DRAFT_67267 [Mycena galopus ATCC 62051]|nr:hypothetical protein K438DRAFT_67267 [Mycena galopus ATCC 62051]
MASFLATISTFHMKIFLLHIALAACVFTRHSASALVVRSAYSGGLVYTSNADGSSGTGLHSRALAAESRVQADKVAALSVLSHSIFAAPCHLEQFASQLKPRVDDFFTRASASALTFLRTCANAAFGILLYAMCIAAGVLSGTVVRRFFPPAPELEQDSDLDATACGYLAEKDRADSYPVEKQESPEAE